MKNLLPVLMITLLVACETEKTSLMSTTSPDGRIELQFILDDGKPAYRVSFEDRRVIDTSFLGFELQGEPALNQSFKIAGSDQISFSETWEMPWGEQREVLNKYSELTVDLQETKYKKRKMKLVFRVFDDGVGFRYSFPEQESISEMIVLDENTQFNLTGDHRVWWLPGDWDIYEHTYSNTRFSKINAIARRDHPNLGKHTYIPENAVLTPVTMKTDDGIYLSFHEADLTNYSGMTLKVDTNTFEMQSELVGSEITGYKAKVQLPFSTPWRTIQIADRAGDLVESKMIVNLNEPNKLGDISWFTPMKYVGIWWEMHLGKSTWDYESSQSMNNVTGRDVGSATHGATTENAKRYIDFAAKNNIGGILIEGWNTGWDHWIGFDDREGVFDFVTPYPDYDLEEVVRYGREKGVELIMHHETSAAPRTYEQQMDTAFALMQSLGIHSVKTGYVGKIIPDGEYHHGQWMVNHYQKVLETAAKYQVAINAHEPIKATGKRRTFPNAISREGLRGQEFNAWSVEGGNPVDHLATVIFTRMLSGPIDYTPGIFNLTLDPYRSGESRVRSTLAQQLGLYVVIYSPIQMAADLPEHYEERPDAMQFIRDVGVDWEQSIVLDGEVGDFAVIAREEKETGNWFVGGLASNESKDISIVLDFLEEGKTYRGALYRDGSGADWETDPYSLEIESGTYGKGDKIDVIMARGGGFALSLLVEE